MKTLVRGKYVITDAAARETGIIEDGAVLVEGKYVRATGRFAELRQLHPEAAVVGDGQQLVLPGLIDAHSHGRGLSPLQKGVPNDFLENNLFDWAFMPVLDPELITALCAVRHIRNGSTLIHNNAFDTTGSGAADQAATTIKAYLATGIRLAYSPGVRNIDRLVLDTDGFLATLPAELRAVAEPLARTDSKLIEEEYFALFAELYRTYQSEDTRIFLSPSWAQACTAEFLIRAKEEADRLGKIPIHMHCLQTPVQKAFSLRKYGKTAIAYLADLGLLDENTVLAHSIWVTQEDIRLMAEHNVAVTSHPSCNLGMRNGITPVYELLRQGIRVAVGMDDKTINDDEDIIMELRMMHKLHRVPGYRLDTPVLDAFTVLEMATGHAASVVGFAGKAGALRPGMLADLIVVDLDRMLNSPWMSDQTGIADIFIHRALGTDVASVIIGGRLVMEDRKITTLDEEALYREVRKAADKGITSAMRRQAETLQQLKPYCQSWYNTWLEPEQHAFYQVNSRR